MAISGQAWQTLRGLRASPPGQCASDEERRDVFAAALEHAEQLLAAADAVGFATKPLLLFYALSQAGRAICAAHAADPWQIKGHGASVDEKLAIATTTVEVKPPKSAALPLVAVTTGSELWRARLSLALCGRRYRSLPSGRSPSAHDPSL